MYTVNAIWLLNQIVFNRKGWVVWFCRLLDLFLNLIFTFKYYKVPIWHMYNSILTLYRHAKYNCLNIFISDWAINDANRDIFRLAAFCCMNLDKLISYINMYCLEWFQYKVKILFDNKTLFIEMDIKIMNYTILRKLDWLNTHRFIPFFGVVQAC